MKSTRDLKATALFDAGVARRPAATPESTPPLSAFGQFESKYGAWLAVLLTLLTGGAYVLACVVGWIFLRWDAAHRTYRFENDLAVIGALVVVAVGWWGIDRPYVLRLIWCLAKRSQPELLVAARVGRTGPVVWRAVKAAWWAGHYVTALGMMVVAEHGIVASWEIPGSTVPNPGAFIVCLTLHFGFAYAANGMLLVLLATAGVDDAGLERVWRARLVFDAFVAVAFLVVTMYWVT